MAQATVTATTARGAGGTVRNSDSTYTATVTAGETEVIADITVTQLDDTTTTTPAAQNIDVDNYLGAVTDEPSIIGVYPKSTTEADIYFNNSGTAYYYELSIAADFSTTVTTGVSTSSTISFSGLTIATTYYVRIRADVQGGTESAWVSSSFDTLSLLPEIWIESLGLRVGTDNDFGVLSSFNVTSLKSIVNTSGPGLSGCSPVELIQRVNFLSGDIDAGGVPNAGKYFSGSTGQYALDSVITFTGDFTIAIRCEHPGAFQTILDGNSDGSYIAFNGTLQLRLYIDSTKYQQDMSATLADNNLKDLVFKRVGSSLSFSDDGGATFTEVTAAAKTNTFTIANFGGGALGTNFSASWSKFMAYDGEATTAQLTEFFDYGVGSAFTTAAISGALTVNGATFASPPANNIIVDGTYSRLFGTTRRTWQCLAVGDNYTFFTWHKNGDNTPDLYNDVIYAYNHTSGELSAETDLGTSLDDVHLYGGVFEFDGRLVHMEPNGWFDAGFSGLNTPVLTAFSKGSNIISLDKTQTLPVFGGLENGFMDDTGYYGFFELGQRRYIISSSFLPGAGTGIRFINVAYSDDYCNSWTYNRLLDTGDGTKWAYPFYIYNDRSRSEILFGVNLYDTGTTKFTHSFLFRLSTDGVTVTDYDGDFNQDISNNNYLSLSDLTTNFQIDTSGTVDVRMESGVIDGSGVLRMFAGNNAADGAYDFYIGATGSALTRKAIDFGARTIVGAGSHEGGYLTVDGDLYVLEANGGNWKVIKFTTSDDGDTWSYSEDISISDSNRHDFVYGTPNQLKTQRLLTYCRVESEGSQSTGVGSVVFKDIT